MEGPIVTNRNVNFDRILNKKNNIFAKSFTSSDASVLRLARSRSSFCCSSSRTYLASLSLIPLISDNSVSNSFIWKNQSD